ncbi:uncharacterized protein BCR38DRAFT_329449 [Pseudomassariella vexata]|uniref:Zn(2)-C6 fungal-type domain-containing protein n=1 Tax=Pseudomassariella vexata TaxID=1141098 RepID=A0A1Y2EIC5_9PEZI|nr:uncharacterized protein BCR38DRAFT_329449 [Pseudomassariella vexata]ORY71329.1 hypothetical protein BCR38DRAFT_329449 [Pseudomassariella vexata]
MTSPVEYSFFVSGAPSWPHSEPQQGDSSQDHPLVFLDEAYDTNVPRANTDLCWTWVQAEEDLGSISQEEASGSVTPIRNNWAIVPDCTDIKIVEKAEDEECHTTSSKLPIGKTKQPAKPRGQLSPAKRIETGKTRQMVACVRCQMQRIRCVPNPYDEKEDCVKCLLMAKDSKKVIHRIPCYRVKLTSYVPFRTEGFNFTRRWEGTAVKDLGPEDWDSPESIDIEWSLGLCDKPIRFRVRKFKPLPHDVTVRKWRDKQGRIRITDIPPYALTDIYKATKVFSQYLAENAHLGVGHFCRHDDAHELYISCGVNVHKFMDNLFRLWFAMRHQTGSAFLVGKETLGKQRDDDHPDYPLENKCSVPRMVSEQFNAMKIERILKPMKEKVFKDLWTLMQSKSPECFFTIYVAVFILLYEVSAASKDRYRHARDNDVKARYNMPRFVEQLHQGAQMILMFWHYYKRGLEPLTADWEAKRRNRSSKNLFRDISRAQEHLMRALSDARLKPCASFHHEDTREYSVALLTLPRVPPYPVPSLPFPSLPFPSPLRVWH